MPLSNTALPHRKTASAATSHDSCRAPGHYKTDKLYNKICMNSFKNWRSQVRILLLQLIWQRSQYTHVRLNSVDGTDKWLTGKDSKESCHAVIEVLFLTGLKVMSKIVTEFGSVPVEIRTTHLYIHVYDFTDTQTRLAVTSERETMDCASNYIPSSRFFGSSYQPTIT
jgi:hypothetical protein